MFTEIIVAQRNINYARADENQKQPNLNIYLKNNEFGCDIDHAINLHSSSVQA